MQKAIRLSRPRGAGCQREKGRSSGNKNNAFVQIVEVAEERGARTSECRTKQELKRFGLTK